MSDAEAKNVSSYIAQYKEKEKGNSFIKKSPDPNLGLIH